MLAVIVMVVSVVPRALVAKIPEYLSIMSRLPNSHCYGWKAHEVIKSKVLILLMKTL